MSLLDVNTAKAAHTVEVKRFSTISGRSVLSTHASEGGFHSGSHAYVLVNANLHAAETAFHLDDGTVEQISAPQIEADKSEAGLHIGTLKALTAEVELLLAENGMDFSYLTTVLINQLQLFNRLAVSIMDTNSVFAEKEYRDAIHHCHQADDEFPEVGPSDGTASRQHEQHTYADTDNGSAFVLSGENGGKAGDDNEQCPPTFKGEVEQTREFQRPPNAKNQNGDSENDSVCTIHCIIILFIDAPYFSRKNTINLNIVKFYFDETIRLKIR